MSTEQARNEPRTAAGRALLGTAYLKGDAASEGVNLHEAILAIEREAIADFLDHDLPGLLALEIHYTRRSQHGQSVNDDPDYEMANAQDRASRIIAAIRQRIAERQP